jgi:hypothetical protein
MSQLRHGTQTNPKFQTTKFSAIGYAKFLMIFTIPPALAITVIDKQGYPDFIILNF